MAKRTLETRWFFDMMPLRCEDFFGTSVPSVERVDWYAFPCHKYCGVKFREGRLETKLLLDDLGFQDWGIATGNADSWSKWSVKYAGEIPATEILAASGWVAVQKRRHWRALTMSSGSVFSGSVSGRSVSDGSVCWQDERVENGCEVEWSVVTVENAQWWTIGFEAVGQLSDLNANLSRAIQFVLGEQRNDTLFSAENSMAYPSWLWKVKTGGGMLPLDG